MNTLFRGRPLLIFAPEHGGNAVKGGGHPSNSPAPAAEAIDDALGYSFAGHAKTAGTGDPGVAGSKTNPVHTHREPTVHTQREPKTREIAAQPSHEEIAKRAFSLWEQEGRPEGKAEEHWFRAEEQLRRRA